MEFKTARLNTVALIITVLTSVLLIGLSIFFSILVPVGWIFALLMIGFLVACYALSPQKYVILGGMLTIEKVIGTKFTIPLSEIEGYARVPDVSKLHIARTFGNGGLFGFYGLFTTAEYGTVNFQLTTFKNVFLIRSRKGTFAVSPALPERFEEQLRAVVEGTIGQLTILEPAHISEQEYAKPSILLLPICLFTISVIIVLLNYAQMPDRIAVHFDFQGNPDGWGPKTSYLFSSTIPAAVLLLIGIVAFFIVRTITRQKALPNFIVILVVAIQLFVTFISFDTYWVNVHGAHIIPLSYALVVFIIIMVALLFFYYRTVKKSA
jgi:hypothetical protein